MTERNTELAAALRRLAEDPELAGAVHLALEDELIDLRDRGIFFGGPCGLYRNGLAIWSKEGEPSSVIRIGTRDAVIRGLQAAADHLEDPGPFGWRAAGLK